MFLSTAQVLTLLYKTLAPQHKVQDTNVTEIRNSTFIPLGFNFIKVREEKGNGLGAHPHWSVARNPKSHVQFFVDC